MRRALLLSLWLPLACAQAAPASPDEPLTEEPLEGEGDGEEQAGGESASGGKGSSSQKGGAAGASGAATGAGASTSAGGSSSGGMPSAGMAGAEQAGAGGMEAPGGSAGASSTAGAGGGAPVAGAAGQGGSSQGGSSQAGAPQGGSSQAGSSQAGSSQGGSSQAGAPQGGSSQAGSSQAGSSQGGSSQAGSSQGGSSQAGSSQGGSSQAGSSQGGGGQGGSSQAGSSQGGSSTGGATGACAGTIVDWDWNAGTGPSGNALVTSGSTWSVGAASAGPGDGTTCLATVPDGKYPSLADDWVQLPQIDLSAYQGCQVRLTVELWRDCEKVGNVNYDGGNLQFTTDASPSASSAWAVVGGPGMGYDGELLGSCGLINCLVEGQQVWTSSSSPKAKSATYEGPMPGASVTLRFTFFSDDMGQLPGIYVRRLRVEAFLPPATVVVMAKTRSDDDAFMAGVTVVGLICVGLFALVEGPTIGDLVGAVLRLWGAIDQHGTTLPDGAARAASMGWLALVAAETFSAYKIIAWALDRPGHRTLVAFAVVLALVVALGLGTTAVYQIALGAPVVLGARAAFVGLPLALLAGLALLYLLVS